MSDLNLHFTKVNEASSDEIGFLTINRPQYANALSFAVMQSFIEKLEKLKSKKNCRALILRGEGKHFSSGADLSWMKAAQAMNQDDNYEEALVLTQMFEKLYHLSIPTIAVVKGAAYGGALGLISACDIVIASEQSKFSLSEVKLGLLPAVILPYLTRRIRAGDLRRLALTGAVFSGCQAKEVGLVNHCVAESELDKILRKELSLLLSSAPEAVATFKKLYHQVSSNSNQQSEFTAECIAKIRVGKEAQHGLSSFFAKEKPSWALALKESSLS